MIRKYAFKERNKYPTVIYSDTEFYENRIPCDVTYQSADFQYRYVREWAKIPDELWGYMIRGITSDPQGNIYATVDSPQMPILVFDDSGNMVQILGRGLSVGTLHGISLDPDGTIWVSDTVKNAVYHIDRSDRLLGMFGNDIQHEGQYYASAEELENIITDPVKKPLFNKPTRLMSNTSGKMFITDGYGNSALHFFDSEGNKIRSLDTFGTANGEFHLPHSLWIDRLGRIWVCDRENARIQIFDENGNFLNAINGLYPVFDVWTDASFAYVLEGDGRISVFTMNCEMVAQIGFWHCGEIIAHSMCGDMNSNLYLADFGVKGIFKLERLK